MSEFVFLEPLDVLHLRGNRLFSVPEAVMPPWPSVPSGAIRSRMLVDAGVDVDAFARGQERLPESVLRSLGTPSHPGSFRLTHLMLGYRGEDRVSPLFQAPVDLVFEANGSALGLVQPVPLPPAVACSWALPNLPVLKSARRSKPGGPRWLAPAGWARYLEGEVPRAVETVAPGEVWEYDPRLGIALDPGTGTARAGHIYTSQAVAFHPGRGFVVGVDGAHGLLPSDGVVRLGGDGRGARVWPLVVDPVPESPWDLVDQERRFRLVLTTPGVFPQGWQLPGLSDDGEWIVPGATARLAGASVPRFQVMGGWDLARRRPKGSIRAAPCGSVYWFDKLRGDVSALRQLAREGFWPLEPEWEPTRRAEGFNNFAIAAWPRQQAGEG